MLLVSGSERVLTRPDLLPYTFHQVSSCQTLALALDPVPPVTLAFGEWVLLGTPPHLASLLLCSVTPADFWADVAGQHKS